VIAAVEAGLGISFISKLAAMPAEGAGRLKIVDTFEPYKREFYLVTHTDAENTPMIRQFSEIIDENLKRE